MKLCHFSLTQRQQCVFFWGLFATASTAAFPCIVSSTSPFFLAPLTHSHTHTLASPTQPGTRRCRAKNGALLRLTRCGVLTFPAIKTWLGRYPLKHARKERQRIRKQGRGEGGRRAGEGKGSCVDKGYKKRGIREGRWRDILLFDYPATPVQQEKKSILVSFTLSLLLSLSRSLFFKCCFHLAHGSTPSNSWVSQTKSYFLIHSLSHIIILLDCVAQFFFFFFLRPSFPALPVLYTGWHHITASMGQRQPGSYSIGQRLCDGCVWTWCHFIKHFFCGIIKWG